MNGQHFLHGIGSARQIGIWRTGGAAILAPRTCEGGVPALAQGRGEYEFPAQFKRQQRTSSFAAHVLILCFFRNYSVARVIANQCAHWCGNLPVLDIFRTFCGRKLWLLNSYLFSKDMQVTGSPRYQCAHWYHPPHKCGGQGRVPHRYRSPLPKQPNKFQFVSFRR